jgi:predicted dehydrogenase
VKTAVLGFGYWAPNLLRALVALSRVEDVLVVESASHRRSAAEAQFPGIRTTSLLSEALDNPSIESVFICTPARTHFEIGDQVLRAGKNAFIEKPFATSSTEARRLFQTAHERSLVVYPGHIFLHSSYFLTLQAMLGQRALGDLRYAVARRASLGPRAREDINATWDYLIHDVYVLNVLLEGAPLSVSARGGAYLRAGKEDVCFAVLEYPDNLLVSLYSSWYAPEKARSLLLVGSEAMLDYDEQRQDKWRMFDRGYRPCGGTDQHGNLGLELFDRGIRMLSSEPSEEPLRRELRTFLECVEQRRQPPEIKPHVLQVTETIEAINASMSARGQPISVATLPGSDSALSVTKRSE